METNYRDVDVPQYMLIDEELSTNQRLEAIEVYVESLMRDRDNNSKDITRIWMEFEWARSGFDDLNHKIYNLVKIVYVLVALTVILAIGFILMLVCG